MIEDTPQIKTIMSDGNYPVTTVVDAPWVSVTSLNGMTGDVIVEPVINGFTPNHPYVKGNLIVYENVIYTAKENFTSGSSFNSSDWDIVDAATVSVGTTTTLSPGSSATVTNSGTPSAAILNFGIPQGATGNPGPANTLSIGSVTSGSTASATITGTSPNQTLNLTLPKGDKGDTGNTGATGPANVLSIGTVVKGDDASATITGTSPSQTLNLVLPKGDKGDKGDTGSPGAPANVVNTKDTSSTTDAYSTKYVEDNFQAKDSVTVITKNLQFNTSWTNTGISGPDLPADGMYAMYVMVSQGSGGQWAAGYSAIISWRAGDTNDSKTDEILLMHSSHADNGGENGQRLFLRIKMNSGHGNPTLQYAFRLKQYESITGNITFTFRRLA